MSATFSPPEADTAALAAVAAEQARALAAEAAISAVAGAPFVHDQGAASSTWIIDHALGIVPAAVGVVDSAGTVVLGAVRHPTVNRTIIEFSAPFSGKAYLRA